MKFAKDRILLAEELLAKLAEKGTSKGEGYQKTRQGFGVVLREYGNGAHLISKFIGGVSMNRDHVGDPNGRDPFVVVPPQKQREALRFLEQHILTDRPFRFSPKLLRRLGSDRWVHWGSDGVFSNPVEYPVHERILAIQRVVLEHTFDPDVLSRIQNNALDLDSGGKVKPPSRYREGRGLPRPDRRHLERPGQRRRRATRKAVELSIVKRNLRRTST